MVFKERREYFISPTASFESSGLYLLVGIWCNLQWRLVTWGGGGFEFRGSIIVRWLVARKGVYKTYWIRGMSQLEN